MSEMKRALISVYEKEGIVEFAKELVGLKWRIISTGGTAKVLKEAGIKVTPIEKITGNPECFDGRMKTISFQIEAGILYDRRNKKHREEFKELKKIYGLVPIDMVVCNLYPFPKIVQNPNATLEEAIEMIDIGGPTMIRAAAKNFKNVIVVVDPKDYKEVIKELKENKNKISFKTRIILAFKAFKLTALYDTAIQEYFSECIFDKFWLIQN